MPLYERKNGMFVSFSVYETELLLLKWEEEESFCKVCKKAAKNLPISQAVHSSSPVFATFLLWNWHKKW